MKHRLALSILGLTLGLVACVPVPQQAQDVNAARAAGDRLTLGMVQREIHVGMSSADVAAALGAPNIVTSDERRRETWVYDRISTERVYSNSGGGVNALFLAGASTNSGVAQTSQRTLTVIVRFDEQNKVRDFNYRASSF